MPKKVLVVDDDPSIRRAVQTVLEAEGIEVCTASNGAECLLAVGAESPDLVILDVNMPVMDGLRALRALRGSAATKALPVIMLTARDEDDDVARGWMSGVDLYLTKPFEVDELRVVVRRALEVTGTNSGQQAPEGGSAPPSAAT